MVLLALTFGLSATRRLGILGMLIMNGGQVFVNLHQLTTSFSLPYWSTLPLVLCYIYVRFHLFFTVVIYSFLFESDHYIRQIGRVTEPIVGGIIWGMAGGARWADRRG